MAETNWSSQTTPAPNSEFPSRRERSPQSSQIPPFQTSSVDLPRNLPPPPPPESRNPRRRSLPVRRKLTLLQRLVLGLEPIATAIASKLPAKAHHPAQVRQSSRSRAGRRGRPNSRRPPDPREQPFGRFPAPDDQCNRNGAPPPATFPDPFTPPQSSPPPSPVPGDRRRPRRAA